MNISESFKIAVKAIKANWMRSLLTMLGIIIGISSVIMIVGAGTGARDYIVSLIEDMGSNAVMVSVDTTQATDNDYITLKDVENIKSRVNGVDRCSPMLMGFGKATIDSQAKEATAMLVGVNSDIQYALTEGCTYGRFFTDEEYSANSPIAVIGINSAQSVFGYEDVTGEYVTVSSSGKSMKVKIAGVANIDQIAQSAGGSSSLSTMFQQNEDSPVIALFMPCTTLTQITGANSNLSSIFVIAQDGADNDAVGNATVNYLKAAHGNFAKNMYIAQNMATYIQIVDIVMQVLTAFIACVGAISLIVGGIGVMNIMLVRNRANAGDRHTKVLGRQDQGNHLAVSNRIGDFVLDRRYHWPGIGYCRRVCGLCRYQYYPQDHLVGDPAGTGILQWCWAVFRYLPGPQGC